MTRVMAIVIVCLGVGAGSVQAQQGADPRGFVDGTVYAGIERQASAQVVVGSTMVSGDADAGGTVGGGGFGVGTWLTPRVSLRLDVAVQGRTSTDVTSTAGSSALGSPTTRSQSEMGTTTFSVLAGYHPEARGRLRVGYLAGIAVVRVTADDTITTTFGGLPPFVPPSTDVLTGTRVSYPKAAVLGVDGAVRVTDALAIVPQVRVLAFSNNVSIRPGVGVRMTF